MRFVPFLTVLGVAAIVGCGNEVSRERNEFVFPYRPSGHHIVFVPTDNGPAHPGDSQPAPELVSSVQLPSPVNSEAVGNARGDFWIYRDLTSQENHGVWSNWMPENAGQMMKLSLGDKSNPAKGETAVRVDIAFASPFWCGIAVSSKENYWANQKGPAFDLTGAKKLVFYARGKDGGEVLQIKFAILHGEPHGDSCPTVESRWLELTRSWIRYEVDISKLKDASRVVTPFAIVTNAERNSGRDSIVFFLDQILVVFE